MIKLVIIGMLSQPQDRPWTRERTKVESIVIQRRAPKKSMDSFVLLSFLRSKLIKQRMIDKGEL